MVLILMGTSITKSTITVEQSAQAGALARTCADRAIRSLRDNDQYTGNETFNLTGGSCRILTISGAGGSDRTVCVEGASGRTTRRIEVVIEQLLPDVRISSWREVVSFSLCS